MTYGKENQPWIVLDSFAVWCYSSNPFLKVAKLQPLFYSCVCHMSRWGSWLLAAGLREKKRKKKEKKSRKRKNGLIICLSVSSSRSSCPLCLSESSFRNSKPETFIWTWCYSWVGFSAVPFTDKAIFHQAPVGLGDLVCSAKKNRVFFFREVDFYCSYFLAAGDCSPHSIFKIVYVPSKL